MTSYRVAFCSAWLALALPSAAGAVVLYDEAIQGDLSNAAPSLTVLPFDLGTNSVRGDQRSAGDPSSDFDSFAFTVPAGMELSSALFSFTLVVDTGLFLTLATTRYFLNDGNTGLIGQDYLDWLDIDLFGSNPAPLFATVLPQGPGEYGIYNREHKPLCCWTAFYQFDFEVVPTHAPAPALLLVLAAMGVARRSLRPE